jgi:radical SAM protein with 4Fe4S-binding SPASM domain
MLENVRHVILSVTRDCNLRCAYCFERDKEQYRGEKMSLECFSEFLECLVQDRLRNTKGIYDQPIVEFCFHGGEPTLVGIPLLQSFIDRARWRLGPKNVSFGMQCNGTLLNADWQAFAVKNDCHISISLDGFNYHTNRFRFPDKRSFKRLNPLRKKIKISGVLALLTKNNVRWMVFYMLWLYFKHHRYDMRANVAELVYGDDWQSQELTGEQLVTRYYIPVLRVLSFFPHINEFHINYFLASFVIRYIYTRIPGQDNANSQYALCGAKFCGAGNGIINLLPDGTLWACQRSLGLAAYRLGNIYDDTPEPWGLASLGQLVALALPAARSARERGCDACFAADICDHGCRAFSLLKSDGTSTIEDDLDCAVHKALKKYLYQDIYNNIILYALLNKMPVQTKKSLVNIYLPLRTSLDGESYRLAGIRDQNIQVFNQNGRSYIAIPKNKVNRRNLFWAAVSKRPKEKK